MAFNYSYSISPGVGVSSARKEDDYRMGDDVNEARGVSRARCVRRYSNVNAGLPKGRFGWHLVLFTDFNKVYSSKDKNAVKNHKLDKLCKIGYYRALFNILHIYYKGTTTNY